MLETYARVSVPLSREEFITLARLAQGGNRLPREEAGDILRRGLMCGQNNQSTNRNDDTSTLPGTSVVVASSTYQPVS